MGNYSSGKVYRGFPRVNLLSSDGLDEIHRATLSLLNNTGVRISSSKAAALFKSAGAAVVKDNLSATVKIPPQLVDESIASAPGNFVYQGREAGSDYTVDSGSCSFTTFGECINIIDLKTRACRSSTKADCRETAIICDYLDSIKVLERPLNPADCPVETQPLHNAEAIFSNTTKHSFIGPGSAEIFKQMAVMAEICVGGSKEYAERKIFTATVCPVSPLTLSKDCCEIIMEAAGQKTGLLIFAMPLSGATSVSTMAGTLISQNAEILSGLVLAQLVHRGTQCTYGSAATIMDLTMVDVALGAPEMALLSAGAAQLARHYNLPAMICGGMTDSKVPDSQMGYEFGYSAMLCALTRGNLISGLGVLDKGLTFDYAKLLLDVEMSESISGLIPGMEISPETMALEVIGEVGPGGEFLTHKHTFKHMRNQSQVKLFDRQNRFDWDKAGSRGAAERAYDEAALILGKHKPAPLSGRALQELSDLIRKYETKLKIK
jgi:trimethylamine---corrinoid protein Co-methyltransferase